MPSGLHRKIFVTGATGFIGQALGWYAAGAPVGFIASVIGAIVLLFIVGKLKGSSAG